MRRPIIPVIGILAVGAFAIGTGATAANSGSSQAPARIEASQPDAISAAKRKARKQSSGHRAYGRSQTQIACTPAGCNPIPRGCRVRPGMNPFTWNPTGFDEIVCPYYR